MKVSPCLFNELAIIVLRYAFVYVYIICIILISRVLSKHIFFCASYALSCYVFYFSAMLATFMAPLEASYSLYFHLH